MQEENIMKYIKENWKFLIFVILASIIGGYFTTMISFQSLPPEMLETVLEKFGSEKIAVIISTVQSVFFSVIYCILGLILSNATGLWKKFIAKKNAFIAVIIISLAGGLALSVFDRYVFGSMIEPVRQSYETKPTIEYIIASFTYGGVCEEVMLRLFVMSLLSWIIAKIFFRKKETIPIGVFATANIISALLFAAGHIPATIQTFGYVNALILFRCFLMNGAFGIAFGWLYRKHGIHYAMLAHFGAHLISKLIWIIFI